VSPEKPVRQQLSRRYVDLVVALFVIAAVGLLVLWLGLRAWRQIGGEETFEVRAVFDKTYSVAPATEVTVGGVSAGRVSYVGFNAANQIEVTMLVRLSFRTQVRVDSVVQLTWPNLVGIPAVDISPGSVEAALLEPEQTLQSKPSNRIEGQDIAQMIAATHSLVSFLNDPQGPLRRSIENLATISESLASGQSSASRLLNDDGGLYEDLIATTRRLRQLTQDDTAPGVPISIRPGSQLVVSVDEPLNARFDRLEGFLDRVDQIVADLIEGRGTLGALLKTDELHREAVVLMQQLSRLAEAAQRLVADLSELTPSLPSLVEESIRELEEVKLILDALKRSFLLKDLFQEPVPPEATPLYRQAEPGDSQPRE